MSFSVVSLMAVVPDRTLGRLGRVGREQGCGG